MTKDELIGRNLARMRADRPQSEIAAAMRERGYKWSQATVWAVEKGERPLRLTEAADLSKVLDRKSHQGATEFLASSAEMHLVDAIQRVMISLSSFEAATSSYLEALDNLAMMADMVSEMDDVDEVPPYRWFAVRDWLEEHSPALEALAAERVHRLEDGHDAQGEMIDRGARTYRELVEARDAEAREQGFEDYETKWAKSYRIVGNYSGMRESIRASKNVNDGIDPETS